MGGILTEKQEAMRTRISSSKKPRTFTATRAAGTSQTKPCVLCSKETTAKHRYCRTCTTINKEYFGLLSVGFMDRRVNHGLVYFIQAINGGPIKIGYTAQFYILRRINELQIGNPYPLRFIGIINNATYTDESRLHTKFQHLRLCGEWFKPEPELLDFIKTKTTKSII